MAIVETIGGAFLSAFLQVLFDRLSSQEFIHFIQGNESVHDLLKKLKIVLLSVNALLNDAEAKQLRDPAVREWLVELEEAIFDADDLVDEINTRALETNYAIQVPEIFSVSLPEFFNGTKRMILKIIDRVEFMLRQKDFLGLSNGVQVRASIGSPPPPLEGGDAVYGREDDETAILGLVLSDVGDRISVVSIVGMAGIGKTTIAQIVYSNDRTKENFDLRAWVSVSDEFDVLALMKAILEAVTRQTCRVHDLYNIQDQLNEALRGKRFLFVLDDVWNENYMLWDALKSPLESAGCGSKIIVTTRCEKVASMMSKDATYYCLKGISDECSRLLFAKHAFNGADLQAYPELESIGQQIVRRCKGLPLAIKSLGGLLRFEMNAEVWKKILNSDIWELSEKEHNILPSLWLSYYHLPPYLKRCFAYCSIFPKAYPIKKENLVLLWMAEDLLHPQKGRRVEDVGEEYIHSLVSRSLLQKSSANQLIVTMHDLVHDLAMFVSRGFCRRSVDDDLHIVERKHRRFSFMNENISASEGIRNFEMSVLSNNNSLRTFLPFRRTRTYSMRDNFVLQRIPRKQHLRVISLSGYRIGEFPHPFGNLKHLRYFDLSDAKVEEMPDQIGTLLNLQTLIMRHCSLLTWLPGSIGNLKHLRYLDLSFSGVQELPNTICDLCNLQTLLLTECRKLTRLPTNIRSLTSLVHLNIAFTNLQKMPSQMCEMKGLRRLTNFVVGNGTGASINELRELQHLRDDLEITRLENVVATEDLLEDNLKDKKYLDKLLLKWKFRADDSHEEQDVLEKLRPHTNLKELSIEFYNGRGFSSWLGDSSFSAILKVSLIDCRHCSSLPPLGQLPSLVTLEIRGFSNLMTIGTGFYSNGHVDTPFKSLKTLYFENMLLWETWILPGGNEEDDVFPCLEQLYLIRCQRLNVNLPDRLFHLTIRNDL